MQDDIDWLNASSDSGLVQLCREMAALAYPVEKLISLTSSRSRSSTRRRGIAVFNAAIFVDSAPA